MKKIIKKIIKILISNDFIFKTFDKLLTIGWMIKFQRQLLDRENFEIVQNSIMKEIFKEPLVLHGPFKGLKYPEFKSRSSSLYSKLIGSYEMELHNELKNLLNYDFEQVINIGCAEGYYAVGLAMNLPKAEIHAFDIDSESRDLTLQMASLNGVLDRVKVKKNMTSNNFKNFDLSKKTLIISDIEGNEKNIFVKSVAKYLKNCYMIIETHDWVDINISSDIEQIFKNSHDINTIQSIGDNIKAKTYSFNELKGTDLLTKFRVFEEGRRYVDEWLIMYPKNK